MEKELKELKLEEEKRVANDDSDCISNNKNGNNYKEYTAVIKELNDKIKNYKNENDKLRNDNSKIKKENGLLESELKALLWKW